MSTILIGKHFDLGGREIYEDRVDAEAFTTAGGLKLAVAVVADGVGGRDRGERAAQLAKDGVLDALRRSTTTDVPTAVTQAVQYAAQAVYNETSKYPGTSTTLSVAVIQDDKHLFVANVGDSQVYLCRNKKITQLTLDHTFANMMAVEGVMSFEAAQQNPRAHVVMRALGPKPDVQVDIGFYVGTMDMQTAEARGRKGIPLQTGDTILVCSDGLTKDGADGKPLIRPEEIWQVVSAQEEDKAARSLVSFALGRDASDNVSVALLQTPDKRRKAAATRRDPKVMAAVFGGIALVVIVLMGVFFAQRSTTQQTVAEQTREAELAVTSTAVALSAEERELSAEALLIANNATATAEAIVAAGNIQEQEANLAATATAQILEVQATGTAEAVELICLRPENYDLTFSNGSQAPLLLPPPPVTHVQGDPAPRLIEASWTVQNSGECAWNDIQLRSTSVDNIIGQAARLEVRQNGAPVLSVAPDSEATFVLVFERPADTQEINQEWFLVVSSAGSPITLLDLPRFALDTRDEQAWFTVIAPSPTPTETPTPIPTNTPTPEPEPESPPPGESEPPPVRPSERP